MILLGLGSNLPSSFGDRFQNIDLAISYLESKKVKLVKKSSYYETLSYPNKNNPKFINVVIEVTTLLKPTDLASILIFIEEKLERKRNHKNDPRTCDIDIIDFNNKKTIFKYKNLEFIVPHDKLSLRNFVLLPLKEIKPNWIHPVTKDTIDVLFNRLSYEEKNSILKIKKS